MIDYRLCPFCLSYTGERCLWIPMYPYCFEDGRKAKAKIYVMPKRNKLLSKLRGGGNHEDRRY